MAPQDTSTHTLNRYAKMQPAGDVGSVTSEPHLLVSRSRNIKPMGLPEGKIPTLSPPTSGKIQEKCAKWQRGKAGKSYILPFHLGLPTVKEQP
ncbi:hypothetical protein CDAR_521161 [Caerostris darwini]|uniref:Uncharacterized protein n=1 Tax=Caerostris darwini TaxID=1538125 RepID=A0AAV4V9R6_9ARAC|nr:hypothetical protein CDAR_521161 [Caerostris darwini]